MKQDSMKIALIAFFSALTVSAFAMGKKHHSTEPSPAMSAPVAPALANPGVVEIDSLESYSKVYAISDVHGMYDNVIPLLRSAGLIDLQSNWKAGNSLLVIVGDSIDKGPKSIEVIDLWMRLSQQAAASGGRLVHLLGNHEAEFLADPNNDKKAKELIAELKSRGMSVSELTDPAQPRGAFLNAEPVAARIGKWLFCHAGFLGSQNYADMTTAARSLLKNGSYSDDFFIGDSSLLEAKNWWESDSDTRDQMEATLTSSGLYGVVFGHQPSALNVQGAIAQSADSRLIKIDNGMAPQAGSHAGSILVFEQPAEMNALQAPHVAVIRSGSSAHVAPQAEVPGPAISSTDD